MTEADVTRSTDPQYGCADARQAEVRATTRRPARRARLHHRRRAPLRRGHLGASRRRHDELARRLDQLRAARRRVPRLLVGQRGQHRHHQVLPRRGRHRRARVVAAPAHRPRRAQVPRRRARSTATSRSARGRRDLRARADLDAAAPGVQLQLPGLVQRRHDLAAAGQRLLHPGRRRHDGLDPELVPRRGPDLQGRLGRRAEPVAHPLVQGAAVLRRHGIGSGVVHARRRRLGRNDQVRRRHPARGEDGRARRRPPRHRGVRRRPRRARRTRSASCATPASTWTSAARTSPRVQYQNANNSVRVSDEFMRAVDEGTRLRPAGPQHRSRSSRPSTPRTCSARSRRRRGSAPTRASSTTTRSTTGTPTPRPAGSPRPTRARST